MNNLKLVPRTIAAVAKRPGVRASSHGESYVAKKIPTFNELPTPKGSWKDAHASKQRKYNVLLLLAATAAGSSAFYVYTSGFINLKANRPDISSVVKK